MVIFDTDILVWYFRGNDRASGLLSQTPFHERAASALCLMELIQGCRDKKELKTIRTFFRENISSMVHPNDKISEKAIDLLEHHALSDGLRTVDSLIAASALINDAPLVTANWKHFKGITGLTVERFRP